MQIKILTAWRRPTILGLSNLHLNDHHQIIYNNVFFGEIMQIIQELTEPQKIFRVQEDGSETVEYKAPTSLQLRAARTIQELIQVIQGLERSLNTQNQNVQ